MSEAHIGQVLDVPVGDNPAPLTAVPGLWAARIDPKTASDEYKAKVIDDARSRYSGEMLEALKGERESPCTEEMAAFDYSRRVELLVSTTQRSTDIRSETSARLAGIIDRRRDAKRSVFVSVVSPAATPIVEACRAMLALKDTGIPPRLVCPIIPVEEESCPRTSRRPSTNSPSRCPPTASIPVKGCGSWSFRPRGSTGCA